MKNLLLLFAAVAFAFTGCYENTGPDTPNVGDITLSYNSMNVDAMGGDFSVDVTADYPFEASTNADWIHITAIGRYTLSFIVAENSANAEREGIITIFCDSYNLSATLTITQKGREKSPNNEIWYTSSDGSVVEPYITDVFGANIVSNTYANGKGVIVFDAPVTSIGNEAFRGCYSLTSVTIGDSVTSIEYGAFNGCRRLTSVTIPDSVTSIGEWAFHDCTSLTSVTIPDSVTSIGSSAFYGCTSLTSVTIPDSVTSIGEGAFYGCTSLKAFYGKFASSDNRCLIVDGVLTSSAPAGLTEYTIPDSVTSIGYDAFGECTSLTSVTIPDSVTLIEYAAFFYCTSLKAFYGKYASADNRCLIVDGVLTSFAPAGLTEYTIPDSVTLIEYAAFFYCTSLTSVAIPDSVTSIGYYAFYGCRSLTSVTIGDSVTSTGEGAFSHCTSLTNVYCKPTTPPAGNSYMFDINASGRKIYVPTNSVDAYKSASYWSDYASDIIGYDF